MDGGMHSLIGESENFLRVDEFKCTHVCMSGGFFCIHRSDCYSQTVRQGAAERVFDYSNGH